MHISTDSIIYNRQSIYKIDGIFYIAKDQLRQKKQIVKPYKIYANQLR